MAPFRNLFYYNLECNLSHPSGCSLAAFPSGGPGTQCHGSGQGVRNLPAAALLSERLKNKDFVSRARLLMGSSLTRASLTRLPDALGS